jgi:hypothetical protein
MDPDGVATVVWSWPGVNDCPVGVRLTRSSDGGATWSTPATISGDTGAPYFSCLATAAGGRIDVAWYTSDDEPALWYRRSLDGGATWSAPLEVSDLAAGQIDHVMAWSLCALAQSSSGDLALAWVDIPAGATEWDVHYSQSSDGGQTWLPATNVSGSSRLSASPSLAWTPDGTAHVVWHEEAPAGPAVFLATSVN